MMKFIAGILAGVLLLSAGCRKYEDIKLSSGAGYIRLYNGLTNFNYSYSDVVTYLQDRPVSARLTVYVDPDTDRNGILNTAKVIDNIYPKSFYYMPQPDVAGSNPFFDADYPGSKVVEVSPGVNGLDLSRWASIPAGKHHFVFTLLPLGQTSAELINSVRFNKVVDTTVEISSGHYYTLEPVNTDAKYRMYCRDEGFEQFQANANNINVRFINLCSGNRILPDSFDIWYNYHYTMTAFPVIQTNNDGTPRFTGSYVERDDSAKFLTRVHRRFDNAPYVTIPMIPRDSLLWPDGTYLPANLMPRLVFNVYPVGKGSPSGKSSLFRFFSDESFQNSTASENLPQSLLPASFFTIKYGSLMTGGTYPYFRYDQFNTCGKLWQSVFINGPPRLQPLISTIEFMDNYIFSPTTNTNNFLIDNTTVRIYTIGVEQKYGNPY